ncbi:MAG: hypothetical protein JXA89_17575 [Anaerolineae bacterium]|nr:hypothetical protein [Anaerolineae bacterium]
MSERLPDSYESLFDRAIAQIRVGNTEEAIALTSRIVNRLSKLSLKTIQRNPDRQALLMNAWDLWVEMLRWEERFQEARQVCEHLFSKRPDLVAAQTRIWMLTIEMGEVQAGLEGLRRLLDEHQDFDAQVVLGIEYRRLQQYQQAEACFKMALSIAQSNEEAATAYEELVRLYQETARVESVLEAWSMCVVLDPERIEGACEVYRWLIECGEFEKAKAFLQRETNDIRSLFYRGLIDWQSGRQGEAKMKWQAVLDINVDENELAVAEWMEAALRFGKPDAVLELADAHGDLILSIDAQTMIAIARVMQGQVQEGAHELQHIVEILKRRWPAQKRIPDWWKLVVAVVSDEQARQDIAEFFER